MGTLSELHHDLETIAAIMGEGKFSPDMGEKLPDPVLTAEQQLERKIDWLVREMDELCALANNPETRDLIASQSIGVGQIQFRASLILSFLGKPDLRVVR